MKENPDTDLCRGFCLFFMGSVRSWTFDLVTGFSLHGIGRGDDHPHPIVASSKAGSVISRESLRTSRIKDRGLYRHGAALLSLKIPLDCYRTIHFNGPFDLAGKDRSHATRDTDSCGINFHGHIRYGCLWRFNDRDGNEVASRVGNTCGNPAVSTRVKWVNDIPPVEVGAFPNDLGGLSDS